MVWWDPPYISPQSPCVSGANATQDHGAQATWSLPSPGGEPFCTISAGEGNLKSPLSIGARTLLTLPSRPTQSLEDTVEKLVASESACCATQSVTRQSYTCENFSCSKQCITQPVVVAARTPVLMIRLPRWRRALPADSSQVWNWRLTTAKHFCVPVAISRRSLGRAPVRPAEPPIAAPLLRTNILAVCDFVETMALE